MMISQEEGSLTPLIPQFPIFLPREIRNVRNNIRIYFLQKRYIRFHTASVRLCWMSNLHALLCGKPASFRPPAPYLRFSSAPILRAERHSLRGARENFPLPKVVSVTNPGTPDPGPGRPPDPRTHLHRYQNLRSPQPQKIQSRFQDAIPGNKKRGSWRTVLWKPDRYVCERGVTQRLSLTRGNNVHIATRKDQGSRRHVDYVSYEMQERAHILGLAFEVPPSRSRFQGLGALGC